MIGQRPGRRHILHDDFYHLLAVLEERAGQRILDPGSFHRLAKLVVPAEELRNVNSAARLNVGTGIPRVGQVAAWRLGIEAAKALREQQGLDGKPISNAQLATMAGTQESALGDRTSGGEPISFALDDSSSNHSRLVLRPRSQAGRRFALARLLGDRLVGSKSGRLFPATRAYTYRQKMQRAFAAEFLSPFDAVDQKLAGDYSTENQQEVADYFAVSELTIRTLLLNHHRIAREDFDEFEAAAA